MTNDTWKLQTLTIEFMGYGEFRGKYVGKIKFDNGNNDAFTFTLSVDECMQYLSLIQKKVGQHASELGDKITESLKEIYLTHQPVIQIAANVEEK